MTVIGIRKTSFEGRDRETGKKTGEKIEGFNIYITQPISNNVGTGVSADRIFLTEKRRDEISYYPEVGDEIHIMYNRYGKVDSIEKV